MKQDKKIIVITIDNKEFISLTDLARYVDEDDPRYTNPEDQKYRYKHG